MTAPRISANNIVVCLCIVDLRCYVADRRGPCPGGNAEFGTVHTPLLLHSGDTIHVDAHEQGTNIAPSCGQLPSHSFAPGRGPSGAHVSRCWGLCQSYHLNISSN